MKKEIKVKNYFSKENYQLRVFVRLFVAIFIPTILVLFVLSPYLNLEKKEIYENGEPIIKVVQISEKRDILFPLRSFYVYSFEPNTYKFCYINKNTSMIIPLIKETGLENHIEKNLTTLLTYKNIQGNTTTIELKENEEFCDSIKLEDLSQIHWTFSTEYTATEPTNISQSFLMKGWEDKIKYDNLEIITFDILFLFSWWAMLWLFTRMVVFVNKGIFGDDSNKK